MALVDSFALDTLAGIYTVQGNGQILAGSAAPNGIADCLDVSAGVLKTVVRDTDAVTANGLRSEITLTADPRAEVWYSWEFMVPNDWTSSIPFSIMQIHDTPDAGNNTARFPNFLLVLENGQFIVTLPIGALPAENANLNRVASVTATKGVWHKAVLHVNWQINATGFREFFLDGVPVMRQFNTASAYNDTTGPYLKIGIYDCYHADVFGTRTMYYRNLKRYTGVESYTTVLGMPPIPAGAFLGD